MYLSVLQNPWKAAMFQVKDLTTGKIIPHVQWADDEAGTYGQYVLDDYGNPAFDENDVPIVEIKNGNIKLEEINHETRM